MRAGSDSEDDREPHVSRDARWTTHCAHEAAAPPGPSDEAAPNGDDVSVAAADAADPNDNMDDEDADINLFPNHDATLAEHDAAAAARAALLAAGSPTLPDFAPRVPAHHMREWAPRTSTPPRLPPPPTEDSPRGLHRAGSALGQDLPASAERGARVQSYHALETNLPILWNAYWEAVINGNRTRATGRLERLSASLETIIADTEHSLGTPVDPAAAANGPPPLLRSALVGARPYTATQHQNRLSYFTKLRDAVTQAVTDNSGALSVSFTPPMTSAATIMAAIAAAPTIPALPLQQLPPAPAPPPPPNGEEDDFANGFGIV